MNLILIREGCWIYEVLLGFKTMPTKKLSKAKYFVLEMYFI